MKTKTIAILLLLFTITHQLLAQQQNSAIKILDYPASFNELLQPFNGKVVYIDVMASWCKPCLEELPASKELDNFFEDNNIIRLFITIDAPADFSKCKTLLDRFNLLGYLATYHPKEPKTNNSFAREFENIFLKDESGNYNISIPRYAIVDKNGNIVIKRAERPSNPDALKKQLQEVISVQEITEENYRKFDKELWDTYQRKVDSLSVLMERFPEKKDSLTRVFNVIDSIVDVENNAAAIKYASVPSGLQRLYMVRLKLPRDTIRVIWNNLPEKMKASPYGKSIKMHIDTKQLEVGDFYQDLEMTDSKGKTFKLSSLQGKNILLLYDGLGCIGEEGRNYLNNLYNTTSRDSFEIVAYTLNSSLEYLAEAKENYNVDFIVVSDFLQDHSPFKIIYGAQVRPTVFLINKEGQIILKTTGRNIKEELDKFKNNL